jgi:hypothetical protein
MRNIARALTALMILAASTMGMAHAQTGKASDARVLIATVSKDGAVVRQMPYATEKHEIVVFKDAEACEEFQTLPFFPEVRAALDEFVAVTFPGATVVVSCEPLD